MKRAQSWNPVVWGAWCLLSTWMLGLSGPANLAERIPWVLAAAVLAFAAIVTLAPEARAHPPAPVLSVALLGALQVVDVTTPSGVACSTVVADVVVAGLAIWAVVLDPLFFLRVRHWCLPRRG
jgi:hypothetical protein